MPPRKKIDPELLRKLVEVDTLQQWKIAEMFGVDRTTIERRCKKLGLKTQRTGPRAGERHTGWKGGRRLVGGYWYVYNPTHPFSTKKKDVLEHRLVMEKKLQRYLLPCEVVHHIDGDTNNNQIENLSLYPSNGEHLRESLRGRIPCWTKEGMERIQKGLIKRANQIRQGIGVPRHHRKNARSSAIPDTASRAASLSELPQPQAPSAPRSTQEPDASPLSPGQEPSTRQDDR